MSSNWSGSRGTPEKLLQSSQQPIIIDGQSFELHAEPNAGGSSDVSDDAVDGGEHMATLADCVIAFMANVAAAADVAKAASEHPSVLPLLLI